MVELRNNSPGFPGRLKAELRAPPERVNVASRSPAFMSTRVTTRSLFAVLEL